MGKKVIGNGKYSKASYYKAKKSGAAIRTSRGKTTNPRKYHRDSLIKWIQNEKAFNPEAMTVTDPRNLIPFRGKNYGAVVQVLLSRLKPGDVKNLVGQLTKDGSTVLEWKGPRIKEFDGNAATNWVLATRVYEIACKNDPGLEKRLRDRKNPRAKKGNVCKDPCQKFINNIGTIQRTGGVRQCAYPLMQAQYCIDSRYVADKEGYPVLEVRLVVGRSIPQRSGLQEYNAACKAEEIAA